MVLLALLFLSGKVSDVCTGSQHHQLATWEEVKLVGGRINPRMSRKCPFLRSHLGNTGYSIEQLMWVFDGHLLLQHFSNGGESNGLKLLPWQLDLKWQEWLCGSKQLSTLKMCFLEVLVRWKVCSEKCYKNLFKHPTHFKKKCPRVLYVLCLMYNWCWPSSCPFCGGQLYSNKACNCCQDKHPRKSKTSSKKVSSTSWGSASPLSSRLDPRIAVNCLHGAIARWFQAHSVNHRIWTKCVNTTWSQAKFSAGMHVSSGNWSQFVSL